MMSSFDLSARLILLWRLIREKKHFGIQNVWLLEMMKKDVQNSILKIPYYPWSFFLYGSLNLLRDVLACFKREFSADISLNMRYTNKIEKNKN